MHYVNGLPFTYVNQNRSIKSQSKVGWTKALEAFWTSVRDKPLSNLCIGCCYCILCIFYSSQHLVVVQYIVLKIN